MHKSQATLASELNTAKEKVIVGGLYYHYKNLSDGYKVLNVAITEWDDNVCVIYEAQYGEKIIFVRPLASWLDKVEWQGKLVQRFTLEEDS